MRRMSMSCVTSWYRFIQLAWLEIIGDSIRLSSYHLRYK
ncbi:hypothetical protein F383_20447 [Gossypium arboreum]|uniref:Uncharacterized protein n=1 Tax=Gossypium arboreum TaxID=29729 RepID=A0A0B0NMN3_GOSAR|nr:hypothetical protein F383_20447 [Gossypium arboreum]